MQLVPLSSDGRVTAVAGAGAGAVPGRSRVALEPDGDGVGVVALGPVRPRPVGRLAAADAARYAPVLRSLWARGLVGTCTAQVPADGVLVLDLAPAADCVLANASDDLVLLAAERTVTVTREEHHQDGLAGRVGRVAVALTPCTISAGKYAGHRGIEVSLDGRRIGELTRLMAQRYLPMVDEVDARGRRAGCEALVRPDHRGMQVTLRLPAVDATAGHTAIAPASIPAPSVAGTSGAAVPPYPPPPAHPARARRGRRRVLWAGAATVGVLVFAAAVGNGARTAPPAATVIAATRSAVAAAPAPAAAPTSATPTSATPTSTPAADAPHPTVPRTTTRTRTSTTRSTTVAAAPPPAARPRPAPEAAPSGCDPNYSGCVPIASDVDCAGGSGNGPAYVTGPVRVVGKDVYGLDNDHDGIGCESN